jgi:hypothetical protein
MAYFDRFKINRRDDTTINPAEEESLTLLRRIFQALKPLGQITGSGSNRLSIDVNNIVGGSVSISGTPTITVTNLTSATGSIGPVSGGGFDLLKALSRQAYNSGIRANIT